MSCNTSFPASLLILPDPWCTFFYFIHIFYHFKNVSVFFGNLIHFTDNHAVFLCFTIILHCFTSPPFFWGRCYGITLPDRASDPAWSMASHRLSGGVIGWRQLLPSTNCMFMPLFSRHCRMMWCVWRHIVASCFILLIPFSGVICSMFGWFGSCLLTDCNRLQIKARSPPPARYSMANKQTNIYIYQPDQVCSVLRILQRSVACHATKNWSHVICCPLWLIPVAYTDRLCSPWFIVHPNDSKKTPCAYGTLHSGGLLLICFVNVESVHFDWISKSLNIVYVIMT